MGPQSAARMDAIYARQRHIYDLTRKYYLLGRDRLISGLDVPPAGSVLEIGCGTGRNLIAAARRYPQARLFGIDISQEMLATAQSKVAAAGLNERIVLRQGDATDFDAQALFGIAQFDRIFFSYTLSMIPEWEKALACAAAKARGRLDLVDFGQQERLPSTWRRLLFAWLAKFDVAPRSALAATASDVANDRHMTCAVQPLYRGYAWAATLTIKPPALRQAP